MPVSTNDFANKLWKVADFYDEFGLSPKIAALLYDASNIVSSFSSIVDKNDELKAENDKLRELVRDMNECLEHCKLVCEYCKFQGVDCQWFKFIERMRELGIEVDG